MNGEAAGVIRAMRDEDAQSVLSIYSQGIRSNLATFTARVPSWDEWSGNHAKNCRLVYEENGKTLGFAVLSRHAGAPAYGGVAELSLYVDESARGRGVGHMLLGALIEAAEKAGYWTLESVITADNAASIALHRALHFRLVGRRERISYTPDGVWHDTLIFERRSPVIAMDGPYHPPRTKIAMTLLRDSFCVLKMAEGAPLPEGIVFFARTGEENSLVCQERFAPEAALQRENGFRAFKIDGPLDFSLVGVLAGVTDALMRAGVSVFAVSTFDTDYLLVRGDSLEAALSALSGAMYTVRQ